MESDNNREERGFQQRPWAKWILLIAGILMLFVIFDNVSYYRLLGSIDVFEGETLEEVLAQGKMTISLDAVMAAIFLGEFFISCFAKTRRASHRAAGVLALLIGCGYGIAGMKLGLFAMSGWSGRLNVILLLLMFACGGYDLWKSRK